MMESVVWTTLLSASATYRCMSRHEQFAICSNVLSLEHVPEGPAFYNHTRAEENIYEYCGLLSGDARCA